jgi:hypothetical protein
MFAWMLGFTSKSSNEEKIMLATGRMRNGTRPGVREKMRRFMRYGIIDPSAECVTERSPVTSRYPRPWEQQPPTIEIIDVAITGRWLEFITAILVDKILCDTQHR